MRANAAKLFIGDGQNHMAEDDAAEGQRMSKLGAMGLTLPIGDFQSAAIPLCLASERERDGCEQKANG